MKNKALVLLLLFLLSGCRVRDTARLRSVETMGIDYRGEMVQLSISTGEGTEKLHSLHISAVGGSIRECMGLLEQSAEGQELFFDHLRYLVLGESVEPEGMLDFFERAPELRLELPVYLVQGDAAPLVLDEENEIGALLRSLERSAEQTGIGQSSTLLELDRSLREEGFALCPAIAERRLSGYALLRDGEAPRFSGEDAALGLTYLYRGLSYAEFTVTLPEGYAAVETEDASPGSPCAYTLRELRGPCSEVELNAAVGAYLQSAEAAALRFLGSERSPAPCEARLKRGYDLTGSDGP